MDRDSGVVGETNQFLDALPASETQRLMRLVRPVFLEIKTVLFEPGRTTVSDFPRNCVVSLVSPLQDGDIVGASRRAVRS